LKKLRNTWFDVFRFDHDRLVERRLLQEYEAFLDELQSALSSENYETALALARLPEKIRGFGHIKARHILAADLERERLLNEFRQPALVKLAAE